jgi:hypothetical protein
MPNHGYKGFTSNPRITCRIQKTQKQTTRKHEGGGGTSTSQHHPTIPAKEKYISAMVANRGGEAVVVAKHPPVESQAYPQATR